MQQAGRRPQMRLTRSRPQAGAAAGTAPAPAPARTAGTARTAEGNRAALALAGVLTVPVAVLLWRSAYGPLAVLPALGPVWLGW
ncbi:hypothetical protein AN220_24810, partial [Streptomyces nanshensis]